MDSGDFHIRVDDEIENNNATAFLKQINSNPYVVVALGHGRPFYGGLDDWNRASLTQYNPPENMTEMVPLNIRKMTNAYGDTPGARKENADLMSHRAVVAMKRLRLVARQVMKDVWKPQQTEEQFSILMHQRWQMNGYDMQQGDEPSMTIEREVSDRSQGNLTKRNSTGRIDMVVTIGQVPGDGLSLLGGGMSVTKRYVVIVELKYYRTAMELFGKKKSKEVVCSTAASMVGQQIKSYMMQKSAIGVDMCYVPVAAMLVPVAAMLFLYFFSGDVLILAPLVPRWQSSERHIRLKTIMQDRPDLIESELSGLAFDSLQCVFRPKDIASMYEQPPLPPTLSETIYIMGSPVRLCLHHLHAYEGSGAEPDRQFAMIEDHINRLRNSRPH
ncbi:hypothetical protein T484DRAFT_1754663 [Baffinella frigidus]|nr:hypothetical protein T484DRAFT_1754663 [Cryptophyta sp. CCMP2293]